MKRPYIWLFLVLIILVSLCSCLYLQSKENKDSFYEDSGWDAKRLPLIKPYEMLKLGQQLPINRMLGWSIELHIPPSEKEIYYYLNLHAVEKFAVENQTIMVYSNYLNENITGIGEKPLYWFVIVPDQNLETGFATKQEFLSYIHGFGTDEPSWIDPDVAYDQFVKTKCLDWIPDCK